MFQSLRPLIFAASCCLAWMCSDLAIAQTTLAPNPTAKSALEPTGTLQADEVLRVGKGLEQQRRWQEAIQHYEKSLKSLPLNKQITERMQISRVHLDVTRRYADRSFIESVERSTPAQALEVYQDVVSKLETYYVDTVDYSKLALYGTAFLEVALTERDFLQKHLSKTPSASTENFRRNVHRLVFGKRVSNSSELKGLVQLVASEAQVQIGLNPTATIFEFISGSVGLLDPYSSILTPGEYREIMSQIEGNLIGLGVELWAEGVELRIVDVFKGSPAAEAGLLPGHYILEVDGQSVVSVGAKRAADMLRGPENSRVKLVISSGGDQSVAIEVVRKRVEIPSVALSQMQDGQVGYIRITNFQKTTVNEVSRAMFDLSSRGMKSLVIDLRRNPGGLLESAVELADYFLVRGGIVSTRGRNTAENRNYTAHAAGTWDVPLVVLIDGDSASASEIFAGAIRDHDRGYIVGQISYGKGSVQGVFPSDRGIGGLRLTVSRFYSPSGTAISQRGITPHVVVPEDPPASPSTLVALKPPVESGLSGSESTSSGTETGTNLTAQRPVLQPAADPSPPGKPDRVLDKGLEIARQIASGMVLVPEKNR
ncbi:MAG: S41 family peptidase [Planctomycetaceae bacterium]|nr:S41 family peptidase [Planctomycetaceae bacterium]MCE2812945.1 S41 family peptidase [Planctomycetaceae bacterium]